MPEQIIGFVSIVPAGEWVSVKSYHRLEVVTYNGSSYFALGDVSPGVLPTNTAYWMELAHKGDTGAGAGFGSTTATVTKLQPSQQPTVSVNASGPATKRNIAFAFGVPQGVKGDTGNGIASVSLGDDYTLTINFTDGTSVTTDPIRGATGAAAGFGSVQATIAALEPDASPTVSVTASGPNTAKIFSFAFGVPRGEKGTSAYAFVDDGNGNIVVTEVD